MAEMVPFSSSKDDDTISETEEEEDEDDHPGDTINGTSTAKKPSRFWSLFRRDRNPPLSIQSGDIIRPAPSTDTRKSGFYAFLFPIVHKCVKVLFFQVKVRRVEIPITSWIPLFLGIAIPAILFIIAIIKFPPAVNLNIVESFQIPDHISSIHWDAYTAAIDGRLVSDNGDVIQRRRRSLPSMGLDLQRRSSGYCPSNPYTQRTMHTAWYMDLVFRVPDTMADRNILTNERIRYIHSVEEHIYNDPNYLTVCHKSQSSGVCDPITSLLTYLYPRESDGSYVYGSDGLVPNIQATLFGLKQNLSVALWFTGGQASVINGSFVTATLLRSQIRVGLPLPGYCGISDRYSEQNRKVEDFFVSLIPYLDSVSTKDMDVMYSDSGSVIFDTETSRAIEHDIHLAIPSGALILFLVFILSGFSIFSTITGVVAIITCFPLAFFVYWVILGIRAFGVLNIVSVFVIIGIGVDDVFVFLNTFKQSAKLKDLDTVHKRLTHTIIVAGKATFFTSITTSVAFFANAISLIPAVRQFGIFMGLIILFCYTQVTIIMPFYLHIWHCLLSYVENWLCCPFVLLYSRVTRKVHYSTLPPVRMSNIADDDSGIGNETEESENSSTGSDDTSTGSGSDSSPSMEPKSDNERDKEQRLDTVPLGPASGAVASRDAHHTDESTPSQVQVTVALVESDVRDLTAENRLTAIIQVGMMWLVAVPVLFPHLLSKRITNSCLKLITKCSFVWLFVLMAILSIGGTALLQPTNHPPQFFDPDSNIQKLLDLKGNLTDARSYNCWACSAWYTKYGADTPPPPPQLPPSNPGTQPPQVPTSNPGTPRPPSQIPTSNPGTTSPPQIPTSNPGTTSPPQVPTSNPRTTSPQVPTSKPRTPPPTTQPMSTTGSSPSHSHEPTSSPQNTVPPPTHHATSPSQEPTHSKPTTHGTHTATPTSVSSPTTHPSGITPGTHETIESSRFSNNLVVHVVFGIKTVLRNFSTAHVTPQAGEGNYAVLDPVFHGNFSCPRKSNSVSLDGAVLALCRICKNITDPANGLVLNRSAQCLPAIYGQNNYLSCLVSEVWRYRSYSECRDMFYPNSDSPSVAAHFDVDDSTTDQTHSLRFLSMAFRSTTNEGSSPFKNALDYRKWENFIAAEMEEIKKQSGPGNLYEGAYDLLSSAYQTSEHWVQINTELAAIYGSVYGIIISFVLCSIVVVVLSHNWRIVVSMFLTILGILFTLLALFRVFGWRLGIVEAISLSILVGNSLDYCIHLTEGYLATDNRHLAFVDGFKFAAGVSIRVKRVMAAISFIGVSIISSAATTVIATLPMLGTTIQPFKRFGTILVLNTLTAILYTLVFCSNFLSLFGPKDSKWSIGKIINAVLTISLTIIGYVLLLVAFVIASRVGANIPTPDGGVLFQ